MYYRHHFVSDIFSATILWEYYIYEYIYRLITQLITNSYDSSHDSPDDSLHDTSHNHSKLELELLFTWHSSFETAYLNWPVSETPIPDHYKSWRWPTYRTFSSFCRCKPRSCDSDTWCSDMRFCWEFAGKSFEFYRLCRWTAMTNKSESIANLNNCLFVQWLCDVRTWSSTVSVKLPS